jgi:hypothetical protein
MKGGAGFNEELARVANSDMWCHLSDMCVEARK